MTMKVSYFAPAMLALLSLGAPAQTPVGPPAGTRPGFDPGMAQLVEMPLAGLPGMAPAPGPNMRTAAGVRSTILFPCRVGGPVAIPSGSPGPTYPEPPCALLLDSELGLLSLTVPRSYMGPLRARLGQGGAAAANMENCQLLAKGGGRRLGCILRNVGEVIIEVSKAVAAVASVVP
jgi:hypothetical protein